MGETNIQWCARHRVDPTGECAHGATGVERCLDVECERCWVKGYSANLWVGCTPVSEACRHCWAEAVSKRMGLDVWGKSADRKLTGDAVFASIRSWNRKAEKTGQRRGVFWEDMGDLFEDRPEFTERRLRAFEAMEAAPWLDHMLLTKRPENIRRMVPGKWLRSWPQHVWPGVTAEDQPSADKRIPVLLTLPAAVLWASVEPLITDDDLALRQVASNGQRGLDALTGHLRSDDGEPLGEAGPALSLVILGGESGAGARPMAPHVAERIVDDCVGEHVALFMKQMGSRWAQANPGGLRKGASHGQDPYRWPAWARRREMPVPQ